VFSIGLVTDIRYMTLQIAGCIISVFTYLTFLQVYVHPYNQQHKKLKIAFEASPFYY